MFLVQCLRTQCILRFSLHAVRERSNQSTFDAVISAVLVVRLGHLEKTVLCSCTIALVTHNTKSRFS